MRPYRQMLDEPAAQRLPLAVVSMILAMIGFWIAPIIFGVSAIVTACVALRRREPLARWALIVSIVATVISFALGFAAALLLS